MHVEDGIEGTETKKLRDNGRSDGGSKDLRPCCSELWRENAHPNLFCFGAFGPKLEKPLEISGLVCDLTGNRAVDRHTCLRKVLQYTLVSCRCATYIVFGLQAVDGDDDVEPLKVRPMSGNWAESAGNDLNKNIAAVELRKDRFELAITDEGVSADEGDVEGLVLVDDAEDVFDEGVFLIVGQLAKGDGAISSEVGRIVGVASGTAKWTFPGEFDGQRRTPPQKDGLPCLHYF
jgi:hypothetical protein